MKNLQYSETYIKQKRQNQVKDGEDNARRGRASLYFRKQK
jgi:hypothetical protein